jgi:hypothetical protein
LRRSDNPRKMMDNLHPLDSGNTIFAAIFIGYPWHGQYPYHLHPYKQDAPCFMKRGYFVFFLQIRSFCAEVSKKKTTRSFMHFHHTSGGRFGGESWTHATSVSDRLPARVKTSWAGSFCGRQPTLTLPPSPALFC